MISLPGNRLLCDVIAHHLYVCLFCSDRLVGAGIARRLLLPPGHGGKEPDPSKAVRLGQLLGSGSFGRWVGLRQVCLAVRSVCW
jgi:hypothetical protein